MMRARLVVEPRVERVDVRGHLPAKRDGPAGSGLRPRRPCRQELEVRPPRELALLDGAEDLKRFAR